MWSPGETVVERFVRTDGSIGQHHPMRVLRDDGRSLLGWLPAGTEIISTRLADGRSQREAPLDEMFVAPRVRCRGHWRNTSTLRLIAEDRWSSIWWFFDGGGRFLRWYVNLELPRGRTEATIDRVDGALDVVVRPDRSWAWKDEDEVGAAVAAGRLTGADVVGLRAEGERLIALAEAGAFPFDGTWCDFRPEPDWPRPGLPVAFDAAIEQVV